MGWFVALKILNFATMHTRVYFSVLVFTVYCLLFISKVNKIQKMMYHCSQLAKAIRGEQWLDALN